MKLVSLHSGILFLIVGACQPLRVMATDLAELAKSPAGLKQTYGDDPLQFGELSIPNGPGLHPVIIFIHGGCWLSSYDIKHSRAVANAFTKDGFAVWNLEYRRVGDPGGGWPGTFLDIANGADHLRVLAKEHPLDLSHVIAVGHSAGGHLALWLAARPKISKESDIYRANPLAIAGVVALAPASELDLLHEKDVCGGVVDKLMGGTPDAFPDRYECAMPSQLAPIGVPQTVLVGEQDGDWGWVGQAYVQSAKKSGDKQIQLIRVPDAGHFEVIDPKSSAWPTVRGAAHQLLRHQ